MARRESERRDPATRNTGFWGWVERQVLLLQRDPDRRAVAFRVAWWISTGVVLLGALLVIYALLTTPGAEAAAGVERYAAVTVEARDVPGAPGTWSVVEEVAFGTSTRNATFATFWLPARAENLHLTLNGTSASASSWTLVEDGRARVTWPADAVPTGLVASFTLPDAGTRDVVFQAPADVEALEVRRAFTGPAPAPADAWEPSAGDADVHVFTARDVAAGERIPLGAPAGVGEAAPHVLVVLAGAALLALGAGAAWARRGARQVVSEEEMTLLDHLRELQARIVVVVAFFVGYAILFFTVGVGATTLNGIPVPTLTFDVTKSVAAAAFQGLAHLFVPAGVTLVVVRPVDAALTQLLVSFFLAFVSVAPLAAWQTAAFFGPALEPREERLLLRLVPVAIGLFLAGVVFSALVMVPVTMRVLYGYASALGATPLLAVNDLVSFSVILLTVFGAAFELPLVMAALTRLGVVQARSFAKYWRHAIVVIFIVSGILTPDPTWVSQILLALPLTALYFGGIAAARAAERARPTV